MLKKPKSKKELEEFNPPYHLEKEMVQEYHFISHCFNNQR